MPAKDQHTAANSGTSYPHITVAAIAEKNGEFLFVKENSPEGIVINQPAGHLEPGETLLDAVVRETLEETAWHVQPRNFIGISHYTSPSNQVSYVRHTFAVSLLKRNANVILDDDIIETLWLSPKEASRMQLRSPLVMHDINNYLDGTRYPLDIVVNFSQFP